MVSWQSRATVTNTLATQEKGQDLNALESPLKPARGSHPTLGDPNKLDTVVALGLNLHALLA